MTEKRPENRPLTDGSPAEVGQADGSDRFEELLLEVDHHLAEGSSADLAVDSTRADQSLRQRLNKARHCLQLIDRVRRRGDEDSTPSSHIDDQISVSEMLANISDHPGQVSQLGRFEIVRELGRGGYGIVFLARDPELDRQVALKVPRPEVLLTDELRERFLLEAKTAATLSHANLVPVFEAGSAGAICYIASAYCDGPTLSQWIKEHEPVPAIVAAQLVQQIAEAIQHAHGRGIIHRDLKPGNILMQRFAASQCDDAARQRPTADDGLTRDDADRDWEPMVTDFGLAKQQAYDSELTRTGAILGTPAYMAPEQALGGGKVGEAVNLYALGGILYTLLSGKPPFKKETELATLRAVETETPASIRKLRSDVPRDLEAICLKCLEKRPQHRYRNATLLATDLKRFLDGEPVTARHVGLSERMLRWCVRNPLLATLQGTVALLLVTIAVGASIAAVMLADEQKRTSINEGRFKKAKALAEERLFDTLVSQAESKVTSRRIGQQAEPLALLKEATALNLERTREDTFSMRNTAIAAMMLPDLKPEHLTPAESTVRRFSAVSGNLDRYLVRTKDLSRYEVRDLASDELVSELREDNASLLLSDQNITVDGRYTLAVNVGGGKRLVVWETESGKLCFTQTSFSKGGMQSYAVSPVGDIVAQSQTSVVELRRLQNGELIGKLRDLKAVAMTFRPDGKRLAIYSNKHIRIYDVATRKLVHASPVFEDVSKIVWHPRSQLIFAATYPDSQIHAWCYTDSNNSIHRLGSHNSPVSELTIHPEGDLMAVACRDGLTYLWSIGRRQVLLSLTGEEPRFATDGMHLMVSEPHVGLRKWRIVMPACLRAFISDRMDDKFGIRFSPQGDLISATSGGNVGMWRVADGEQEPRFGTRVRRARWSRDGRHLFVNQRGTTSQVNIERQLTAAGQEVLVSGLAILPLSGGRAFRNFRILDDNKLVATMPRSDNRTDDIVTYDLRTNKIDVLPFEPASYIDLSCSPDARWITAVIRSDLAGVIFDRQKKRIAGRIENSRLLLFSPDNKLLLVRTVDRFRCVRVGSWEQVWEMTGKMEQGPGCCCFSPDGAMVVVSDAKRGVRLLSAATGELIAEWKIESAERIVETTFSPDSCQLAIAVRPAMLHLYDIERIRKQLVEMQLDWSSPELVRKSSAKLTKVKIESPIPITYGRPPLENLTASPRVRTTKRPVRPSSRASTNRSTRSSSVSQSRLSPEVESRIKGLTTKIAADKDDFVSWYQRGSTYQKYGRGRDANRDFEQARLIILAKLKGDEPKAKLHHYHGHVLYGLRRADEAAQSFTEALKPTPSDDHLLRFRAMAYATSGQYEEAIADWDHVLKKSDTASSAYYYRAKCYLEHGNAEKAIADLETYLKVEPEHVVGTLTLAWVLGHGKNPRDLDRASALLKATLQRARSNEQSVLMRVAGALHYRAEEYDEASQYLRRLGSRPNNAADCYLMAMTYHRLGDSKNAIAMYSRGETMKKLTPRTPVTRKETRELAAEAKALLGVGDRL